MDVGESSICCDVIYERPQAFLLDVWESSGKFLPQVVMFFFLHLKDVVQAIDFWLEKKIASSHRLDLLAVFTDLLVKSGKPENKIKLDLHQSLIVSTIVSDVLFARFRTVEDIPTI